MPTLLVTFDAPRVYLQPGDRVKPMYNAKAYSVSSATSPFSSATIARREPTEHDVQIEILFCGICHSDLHQARNEWKRYYADRISLRSGP